MASVTKAVSFDMRQLRHVIYDCFTAKCVIRHGNGMCHKSHAYVIKPASYVTKAMTRHKSHGIGICHKSQGICHESSTYVTKQCHMSQSRDYVTKAATLTPNQLQLSV